jgi:hypothetical protein
LFVTDVVFSGCLNTGGLVTLDSLVHADTSEVGVGGETLPVAPRVGGATQRASNGRKCNVRALCLELLAHQETSLVQNVPVPGAGGRNTSRENADIVGDTVGEGTVLEAEAVEAETFDRLDVTNARTGHTSDHLSLLFQCQLSHEGLGPLVSFFPADTSRVRCEVVSNIALSASRAVPRERTRRHDRRGVSISSEDGGVQRLNVAEGVFVADRSIVSLSIDDGCQ